MHVPVLGRLGFPLKINIFYFMCDCYLQEALETVGYFININILKKRGLNLL